MSQVPIEMLPVIPMCAQHFHSFVSPFLPRLREVKRNVPHLMI